MVVTNIREFQKDKVDIIYKYKPNEINNLLNYGEISGTFLENTTNKNLRIFEDEIFGNLNAPNVKQHDTNNTPSENIEETYNL